MTVNTCARCGVADDDVTYRLSDNSAWFHHTGPTTCIDALIRERQFWMEDATESLRNSRDNYRDKVEELERLIQEVIDSRLNTKPSNEPSCIAWCDDDLWSRLMEAVK